MNGDSPRTSSRRVTRPAAAKVALEASATLRSEPLGPGDRWLTTDEAVAYLGLRTRKALYQAIRRGQVPVHRLGVRRMRFSRAELDRLLRGEARDGDGE